jgi:hypothetical protein
MAHRRDKPREVEIDAVLEHLRQLKDDTVMIIVALQKRRNGETRRQCSRSQGRAVARDHRPL